MIEDEKKSLCCLVAGAGCVGLLLRRCGECCVEDGKDDFGGREGENSD